ncbi:MAG: hypothetical protein EHM73_03285 [Chroococcales cyanobacterium metabat2.561]|nr:MAG: hypothetical protein EHM73_03285 [Chroococcales cyanobacterium metabat2.561]
MVMLIINEIIAFPNLMRYTKILTPDSLKPKTLYLTTMEIAILKYRSSWTTLSSRSRNYRN